MPANSTSHQVSLMRSNQMNESYWNILLRRNGEHIALQYNLR